MRKLAEVLPDPSDRGLSPLPSTPSPRAKVDWKPWARPLEFLARVAPPEGLTVEQTGELVAAYAQALAARYAGNPRALKALTKATADGMMMRWVKFPPLPDLAAEVEKKLNMSPLPIGWEKARLAECARTGKRLPWFLLHQSWASQWSPTSEEYRAWLVKNHQPVPAWLMQAT